MTEFQTWNLETKLNHLSLICLLSTLLLPISWSETRSPRKEFDIYNPRIKFEMFFFRNPRTRICIISHDIGVEEVVYESYELCEVWVSNSISNSSPLPKTHFYRGQPTWTIPIFPSHTFCHAFFCFHLLGTWKQGANCCLVIHECSWIAWTSFNSCIHWS